MAAVLTQALVHFGYIALTGLLVAGGVGVPVPEEILQLTAGYLAQRGVLAFVPALVSAYAGIVSGDVLLFFLAQNHAERLLQRRHVARLLTPRRRGLLEEHFARHAFLTIMVARHLSGFRVPAYILAATHRVRARTFVLADALSALLSVPLVVSLGYLFAERLGFVEKRVHEVELVIAGVLGVSILVWVLVRRVRSRKEARS